MNCEYCGRFVKDETCAGCGAPNRYVHQGDPIRLRAGIDPREQRYLSTSSHSALLASSHLMATNHFKVIFSTTSF